MNEFLIEKIEENLYVKIFEGEKLFLHVEDSTVKIESRDPSTIKKYIESGEYDNFLNSISVSRRKSLSL